MRHKIEKVGYKMNELILITFNLNLGIQIGSNQAHKKSQETN
jgi:hypothetical protein